MVRTKKRVGRPHKAPTIASTKKPVGRPRKDAVDTDNLLDAKSGFSFFELIKRDFDRREEFEQRFKSLVASEPGATAQRRAEMFLIVAVEILADVSIYSTKMSDRVAAVKSLHHIASTVKKGDDSSEAATVPIKKDDWTNLVPSMNLN